MIMMMYTGVVARSLGLGAVPRHKEGHVTHVTTVFTTLVKNRFDAMERV